MAGSIFDEQKELYKQIRTDCYLDLEHSTVEKRSEIIGKMLIAFRLKRGYTQQEISDAIGTARQTYAGYESGRHEPSAELLVRLADIYGISLDILMGRYPSTSHEFIRNKILNEEIDLSVEDDIDEQIDLHDHREHQKVRKKYNRAKKQKP